ncbi:hypothetical protein DV737_g1601, partial [Chaetothyriales sp. CBS 132003]
MGILKFLGMEYLGLEPIPATACTQVSSSRPGIGHTLHSSRWVDTSISNALLTRQQQAIWEAAQLIAQLYPDNSRYTYQDAAKNLRIPYWDSIANPWLPDVTTVPLLQINAPSGQQTVDNPLLNYTFQGNASVNGFPAGSALANFPSTVRWWNGSADNQSAATASLQGGAASNLALTYRFFTTVTDFITFCTTAHLPNQTSNSGTNIENVHNNIHNSVGGYGHMADPTMAGFDPIFWLHHANVDRQLAMWQALYLDSYVQAEVNNYGSYYELKGSTDTGSTPLAPFHNSDNGSSMWTSDGVRSLATFSYSYPELPYWRMNASELQANVRNEVNKLYNPDSTTQRNRRTIRTGRRSPWPEQSFSSITFQHAQTLRVNNAERQWFARLLLEKYAVDTSFTILAFMGVPPADTSQWNWAPNLVGTLGQFIAINSSNLFPNGPPAGVSRGEISLTHTLLAGVDRGIIPDLTPSTVIPLLRSGLQWRVQAADGREIDIASVTGLSIQSRTSLASPAPVVHLKAADPSPVKLLLGDAGISLNMSQAYGLSREQTPLDAQRVPSARVASITRPGARTGQPTEAGTKNYSVHSSPAQSPQPEPAQWSSAIGHASTTGKSGRVIERLQTDIDRLHREAHVLKMRHDEVEKNNETLVTRNQYLQDRNNNYEQSHEATLRQLARKERQVEDLREELAREKERTGRAQEQARAASASEGEWREQANKAKALASQREAEYEVIASCRNMDNDRHQLGLDKVRDSFDELLRQRKEEREKHKKLEILAEYQRRTIAQLDDLNKRLNANFITYRDEMDSAVADMKRSAGDNDVAVKKKLAEMQETIGKMRWVVQVDQVVNHHHPIPQTSNNVPPPAPPSQQLLPQVADSEVTKTSSKAAMKGKLPLLFQKKMAAASRTLLFSCPYAFNPIGVTEFLDRFKNGFESSDQAPFVAYDEKNDVFSMTVDRHDTITAPYFLAQLRMFTDQHVKYLSVIEPRICHKQEPTPRQPFHQGTEDGPDLLDIYGSENSDSAEEDALQAMNHLTNYWYPRDGDIKILTNSVAESIASLTDSAVYPEPQESRVRLVGGDFNAALRKLQNMEPLLALQHNQRLQKTPRANANILLLTGDDPSPSMRFWPISDPEKPSFTRLMVDTRSVSDLEHKYICEKFVLDENGNRETPANLKERHILETREVAQSSIWKNHIYKSIGDESNMEPQLAPDIAPAHNSQASTPGSLIGANTFIEPMKAAQVVAWSGEIDGLADPYTAKPAPPEEPTSSRRRLVAPDSDDDESDEEGGDGPVNRDAPPASSVQETAGDHANSPALVSEKNHDDLISICTAQPSGSVQPGDVEPGDGTGLSIFQGDSPWPEFTETATVALNLLDQHSEIAPSSRCSDQAPVPARKPRQNSTTNLFSILGSDHGLSDADDAEDKRSTPGPLQGSSVENWPGTKLLPAIVYSDPVSNADDPFQDPTSEGWNVVRGSKSKSSLGLSKIRTMDGAFSDNLANHFEPNQSFTIPPAQGSRGESSLPRGLSAVAPTAASILNSLLVDNQDPFEGLDSIPYRFKSGPAANSELESQGMSNSGPSLIQSADSSLNARSHGYADPSTSNRDIALGGRSDFGDYTEPNLVDIASDHGQSQPRQFAIGGGIRVSKSTAASGVGEPGRSPRRLNLIDDRVDESTSGIKERTEQKSDLMSFSSDPRSRLPTVPASPKSQASFTPWVESKEYENHTPFRPNIKAHERAALEKLFASRTASTVPGLENATTARKAKSTRADVRSTMLQRTSNPGKKKKTRQGALAETAEEARLRRLRALEDAYGGPSVSSSPVIGSPITLETLAALGQVTELVIKALKPVFEAGRAFNGKLQFEIELGQAMMTPGCDDIYRDKPISARNWDKMIGTPNPNGPMTIFTNMLTSNGTDIDRALEFKVKGSKVWDQSRPSEIKVTYEFHCQSKQGLDFWLVVNEDGSYGIRNETTTIGMVVMHCPVRVWDSAAVLKGQEIWEDPPRAIVEAISELVKSIYILPKRRQLALTFRQPKSLEITVRKVVLKQVSVHQCGIVDCEHLQLQVSEVKTLATKIHPNDRRLWQAFEKEYQEMVGDNAVYYELSIIDSIMNSGFDANKVLEVGELTPASCTGEKLLTNESMSKLVELTALVLGKIDWVGAENVGTQERWAWEKQKQARRQQQSLPPTARSRMQQSILPASMVASRHGGGSVVTGGSNGYTYVGMADIPGPRAKTNAPVYQDSRGSLFAMGMGGAYVPIPDTAKREMVWAVGELSMIGEEVGPDDSASQYGVPRNAGSGARATLSPAGLARRGVMGSMDRGVRQGYGDSKGPGFW